MRPALTDSILLIVLVAVSLSVSAAMSVPDRFVELEGQQIRVEYPSESLELVSGREGQIQDWLLQSCLLLLEIPIDSMLVHSAGELPLREETAGPLCAPQNGRNRWAWIDDNPADSEVGDLVVLIPAMSADVQIGLMLDEFRAATGRPPRHVYAFSYELLSATEARIRTAGSLRGDMLLSSTSTTAPGSYGYVETVIRDASDLRNHLSQTSRLVQARMEDGRLIVAGRQTEENGTELSVDDVAVLYDSYKQGGQAGFSLDWRGCDEWSRDFLKANALALATLSVLGFGPEAGQTIVARGDGVGELYTSGEHEPGISLEQESEVLAGTWNAQGTLVATGAVDGLVCVWRTSDGELVTSMEHPDWVRSVVFSPDGTALATACDDGYARIWRVLDSTLTLQLPHDDWVRDVAFSPDGSLLATASDDGFARVWHVADGSPVFTVEHPDWVRAVAFSPDGSLLVTGCDDGVVRIWDCVQGELRHRLECPSTEGEWTLFPAAVLDVAVSASGTVVAASDWDGQGHLWRIPAEEYLGHLDHDSEVTCIAFAPGDEYLITGSAAGHIREWAAPGGELLSDRWVWDGLVDERAWLGALFDAVYNDDLQPLYGFAGTVPQVAHLLSAYCCQCARYEGSLAGTSAGMTWFYCDLIAKLWALDWGATTPQELGMLPILDMPTSHATLEETRALPSTRIWFEPRYTDSSQGENSLYFGRHGARIFAASELGYGLETSATPDMKAFISWWEAHWEDIEEYEPEYARLGELLKWSTVMAWLEDRDQLYALDSLQGSLFESGWRFDEWLEASDHASSADLELLEPDANETECIPILASEFKETGFGTSRQLSGGVSGADWSVAQTEIQENEDLLSVIARVLAEGEGELDSKTGALATFSALSSAAGTVELAVPDGSRLRTASSEVLGVEVLVGNASRDAEGALSFNVSVRPFASRDVQLAKMAFIPRVAPEGTEVFIDVSYHGLLEITSLAQDLAAGAVSVADALAVQPDIGSVRQLPDGSHLALHESLGWLRIATSECAGRFSIVGESMVDEATVYVTPLSDAEAFCWQKLADGVDPELVLSQLGEETYNNLMRDHVLAYLNRAGIPYTTVSGKPVIDWENFGSEVCFLDVPTDPVHRMLTWSILPELGPPVVWVAEGSTVEDARVAWEDGYVSLRLPTTVFVSMGTDASEAVRNTSVQQTRELQAYAEKHDLNLNFVDLSSLSEAQAAEQIREALEDEGRNVLVFAHRRDWNSLDTGAGGSLDSQWVVSRAARSSDRVVGFVGCNSLVFGQSDPLVGSGTTSFSLTTGKSLDPSSLFTQLQELVIEIKRQVDDHNYELPLPILLEKLTDFDLTALEAARTRGC